MSKNIGKTKRKRSLPLHQQEQDKLVSVFARGMEIIINEILTGKLEYRSQRAEVLRNIKATLAEMGVESDKQVEIYVRKMYKDGYDEALKQLKAADLTAAKGFGSIHKQAVEILISDIQSSFGDAMHAVERNARHFMSEVTKETIKQRLAEGTLTGQARKTISDQIKQEIQKQGLSALKDKGNKNWTLERYTRMLARTKATEARNLALQNKVLESGYDLVQVSDHADESDLCRPWENKILSLTGKTKGYPTLAEAQAGGLFHPNCRHVVNIIHEDLAKKVNAYDYTTGKRKKGISISR